MFFLFSKPIPALFGNKISHTAANTTTEKGIGIKKIQGQPVGKKPPDQRLAGGPESGQQDTIKKKLPDDRMLSLFFLQQHKKCSVEGGPSSLFPQQCNAGLKAYPVQGECTV